jgi:competence protein ComEA
MKRNRTNAVVLSLLVALAALSATAAVEAAEGKVNINTATLEQLALLPRVGPSVAQRIAEFRKENGDFKTAADLMLVRGIGEKTFELIAPYVAVSGETTLSAKVSSSRKPAPAESSEPKD